MTAARPKVPAPLFPLPPADEASLSVKQTLALSLLRQSDEGLTGHDLGQQVHDQLGAHREGEPSCEFCSRQGTGLAKALKRAGLVTQHAHGVYRAASGSRGLAAGSPTDTGDPGWQAYMRATS